jgi:hypothetical protein
MAELKSLAKALHEPHAAEVSQVAFIKRKNDFSGAFGHLPQSTLLGAFVSRAKKCASAAIFQAVSGIHDHSSRILEVHRSSFTLVKEHRIPQSRELVYGFHGRTYRGS